MSKSELLIIAGLYIGTFITWSTESSGSIIKIFGMITKNNLISISIINSIGIFSRLGFVLQAFAIAWIVDEQMFLDNRNELALGYLITTLSSLLFAHFAGASLINKLHHKFNKGSANLNTYFLLIKKILMEFTPPKMLQVLGYMLLYAGGFSPILVQLIYPDFAARGVALASVVNGFSTLILVSFYDLKTSMEIQKKDFSHIPLQLIYARYIAILTLFTICLIFYWTG